MNHITPKYMGQHYLGPFLPSPLESLQVPIQGSRCPKMVMFTKMAGWLQVKLSHLESVQCAISNSNTWESTIYDHFCPYCRGKREREELLRRDIFCVKHFSTQLLHRATQLLGLLCWMADKKFKGIRFKVNVDIIAGNQSVKWQNRTEFPIVHMASWAAHFFFRNWKFASEQVEICIIDYVSSFLGNKLCLLIISRKVKSDRTFFALALCTLILLPQGNLHIISIVTMNHCDRWRYICSVLRPASSVSFRGRCRWCRAYDLQWSHTGTTLICHGFYHYIVMPI